MFTAVGTNIPITATPTLVATTLPNSIAARVPYDNVAPSVSNAQVDNNAHGNRNPLIKTTISVATPQAPSAENNFLITSANDSTTQNTTAQTTFLAQLAGGDPSPEARGVLVQYEKLLSFGNVKYKPSDAGKPSAPVGLFGSLIQQEKVSAPIVAAPATSVQQNPPPAPIVENGPTPETRSTPENVPAAIATPDTTALPPVITATLQRLNAYTNTVRRNNDYAPSNNLQSA